MRPALLAPVALATVLVSGTAAAERSAFEIAARGGYDNAGGKSPLVFAPESGVAVVGESDRVIGFGAEREAVYRGGLAGELQAGYRFLPRGSAGLFAGYNSYRASAPDATYTSLSRSALSGGVYLRTYLPAGPLEIWAAMAVGYRGDRQSYDKPSGERSVRHHGLAARFEAGVDYSIVERVAAGIFLQFAHVIPLGGCLETGGSKQCSDASPRVVDTKAYQTLTLGLQVKVTL